MTFLISVCYLKKKWHILNYICKILIIFYLDLEDIILDDGLNNKLDALREKYASLFKSGYRKATDPEILAFNEVLVAKEIKYAILTINELPQLEDIAYNSATKEQLEHARKKLRSFLRMIKKGNKS